MIKKKKFHNRVLILDFLIPLDLIKVKTKMDRGSIIKGKNNPLIVYIIGQEKKTHVEDNSLWFQKLSTMISACLVAFSTLLLQRFNLSYIVSIVGLGPEITAPTSVNQRRNLVTEDQSFGNHSHGWLMQGKGEQGTCEHKGCCCCCLLLLFYQWQESLCDRSFFLWRGWNKGRV